MKELPLVFGISGVARCGKDTLANHLKDKLERNGYPVIKISFATAVKDDLDDFLKSKLNISAFTEKTEEKNIIRPLLVAYGTDVCRNKIDKDYWINKIKTRIEGCIENKVIVIIPDVRYDNEVKWIKSVGGYNIHLTRMGIKPANFEEKSNDPIIKKNSDYQIRWKTFTDEKETCSYHVSKLFYKNNWSLYGQFK
jgi:hypothetical protein